MNSTSICTQLIRMLNNIQSRLPASLRAFNFVVLHPTQGSDPLFYPEVREFGQVLAKVAIGTRLSLLSYGKHCCLHLDDLDVDRDNVNAAAFLKMGMLRLEVGKVPGPKPDHRRDEGPSHKDPSRSRSPHAPRRPPTRRVFASLDKSGAGPTGIFPIDACLSDGQPVLEHLEPVFEPWHFDRAPSPSVLTCAIDDAAPGPDLIMNGAPLQTSGSGPAFKACDVCHVFLTLLDSASPSSL
eukprot:s1031_g30.t1